MYMHTVSWANYTEIFSWLALSPDLSTIEHLWYELDKRVRRRNQTPSSVNQLQAALLEECKKIPQAFFKV